MNYLIKVTAACLFTTLSITSYAQTVKTAINSEVTNNVKFLNLESEKYFVPSADYTEDEALKYAFHDQKTIMKDVNADGIQDAVVLLYYCEKTNCHPTTVSIDLVVFKGLGNNQFTKLGAAPLGATAKINSINNGVINVTSYRYGESDAGCCPTDKATTSYKIKNNKLVKIN